TASEMLFDSWAPFDDWMGVSSLLRAIPTQRNFAILRFAAAMKAWLATEDDLFDALRAFSKKEGNGKRTVAEVLHQLTHGDRDA
ncbi:MAG: hypothetical protein VX278_21395, partial [Myxococcota bacterium]|nr:hypothetical protein [Myxococcota bacterium]